MESTGGRVTDFSLFFFLKSEFSRRKPPLQWSQGSFRAAFLWAPTSGSQTAQVVRAHCKFFATFSKVGRKKCIKIKRGDPFRRRTRRAWNPALWREIKFDSRFIQFEKKNGALTKIINLRNGRFRIDTRNRGRFNNGRNKILDFHRKKRHLAFHS